MGTIRVLPDLVANKIAAGEVIERPASIVKELVENALDAGAGSVEIEVEHGGRMLIRVADDGCGMDRADAQAAFGRHATSKITDLEDLSRIGSFGFRGEALPSIAAVSRCRLISRQPKAPAGTEVVIEGGSRRAVQDHPCRPGTIVEVRDLFFNTPARRKFLRSEAAEMGQILETVSRLALSALDVRFSLRSEGRTLLDLPPASRLKERAHALFGQRGLIASGPAEPADAGALLLELDCRGDGIGLRGLIAKPGWSRGNRSQIHLFVNRRWVRSLPLAYAVQAGYHGMLTEGRYPVAILFIDLDGERLDLNVHPAKLEIRIAQEPQVAEFIRQAVQETLSRTPDLAPSLALPTASAAQRNYPLKGGQGQEPAWGSLFDRSAAAIPSMTRTGGDLTPPPIAIRSALRVTRILGQIHGTFLAVETEEGFALVDQHAAHERVMYEALLRNLSAENPERQMLFLDEVLELAPPEREALEQAMPLLTRLGFDLEPFGEGTARIRAVPAALGELQPAPLLRDFLDQVEEGKVRTSLEEAKEAAAALTACKRQSVKARDSLEPEGIRSLLVRLAACENPFTCPHGRPVFFTITFSQLEKQFKRT